MNHLVIAPLLLPLLSGTALLLLRGSDTPVRRALSAATTFALVGLALALAVQSADGTIEVYRLGDWPAPFGIVLVADRLAAVMLLLTAVLAACVVIYTLRGADPGGRYFHVLFQFQLFGLNGAFLTGDLFNLFVFFEVLLIASYGLLLHGGGRDRTRAGLHYVVVNLVGSVLFLFAVGVLYGVLGTLNMADLAARLAQLPAADAGLVRAAGLLLFVVFALKAALLPLHLWLPGAYTHTSAPAAALFAIMTKVGAYAILRVYSLMFGADSGPAGGVIDPWLLPLALLTVLAGTVGVLAAQRLTQQAAYLVVVSAGTLLTAFALGGVQAVAAGLYYLVHTTLAGAALFLLADLVGRARGAVQDRLVPGPSLPGSALPGALFLAAAIAVSGLPPLSGFVGKFLILQASTDTSWMPWVMAVLLGTSLLSVMALARSGTRLFFREDPAAAAAPAPRRADYAAPLLLLAAGAAIVLYADPLYQFSRATAEQVVAPAGYLAAVLSGATGATP